jgi:lipopolysaccharide/colanic/teichoic acid biosynthesis glycosyltransferase
MSSSALRRRVKRGIDILICLVTAPVSLPLALLIAVAVRLSGPGPVLHRATRIGREMEPFTLLKFRTMRVGTDGPGITRSGDERITRVGRWLRASKLDELPQIVNVLRGEMSLVGPRPEDARFVAFYTDEQRQVLSVPPGMTSLAFLRFGHEQAYIEKAHPGDVEQFYLTEILPEKLEIELEYVRTWTVLGDLRILARTSTGLFT